MKKRIWTGRKVMIIMKAGFPKTGTISGWTNLPIKKKKISKSRKRYRLILKRKNKV